ncbi:hypothetical protein RZS08_16095, partial [Arthrospira platensis SPKY1]|nr:hypothetical protein [Arthrospira platensis SPKY1]
MRLDRSKPVSAPQIIWQGHTSLQVDGSSVPVWEVAIAQHAEQALSETNDLTATRLQFRGLALRLRREPRDVEWICRVLEEVYIHGSIQKSEDLNYLRMPENALEIFSASKPLEKALQNENYRGPCSPALPLWQGMTVQRFPALPYFYRHRLEVKSRAGIRESEYPG